MRRVFGVGHDVFFTVTFHANPAHKLNFDCPLILYLVQGGSPIRITAERQVSSVLLAKLDTNVSSAAYAENCLREDSRGPLKTASRPRRSAWPARLATRTSVCFADTHWMDHIHTNIELVCA